MAGYGTAGVEVALRTWRAMALQVWKLRYNGGPWHYTDGGGYAHGGGRAEVATNQLLFRNRWVALQLFGIRGSGGGADGVGLHNGVRLLNPKHVLVWG